MYWIINFGMLCLRLLGLSLLSGILFEGISDVQITSFNFGMWYSSLVLSSSIECNGI
jgi:hypothetical protein